MKVYEKIAQKQDARLRCIKIKNKEWEEKHICFWCNNYAIKVIKRQTEEIEKIIEKCIVSGSGIDGKMSFDYEKSHENKLIFYSSFHVMNENGYYTRWIDFTVIIKPSLFLGFKTEIKGNFGKDQGTKDFIYNVFEYSLNQAYKEEN